MSKFRALFNADLSESNKPLEFPSWKKQFNLCLCSLILTFSFFHFFELDLWLQKFFYIIPIDRPNIYWIVKEKDLFLKVPFYLFPKVLIVSIGLIFILYIGFSYLPKYRVSEQLFRHKIALVVLSLILVPVIINTTKALTNVHCPGELKDFGGKLPYVKTLDKNPCCDAHLNSYRGRCFPAAHASGGFSLASLYILFQKKSQRRKVIIFGLGLGWAMGIYQMLKGAHFLSHTIISMLMVWLIFLILNLLFGLATSNRPYQQKC